MKLFNPLHQQHHKLGALSCPFYRWNNQGTGRCSLPGPPTAPEWAELGREPDPAAPRAPEHGRRCLSVPGQVRHSARGGPKPPTLPHPQPQHLESSKNRKFSSW